MIQAAQTTNTGSEFRNRKANILNRTQHINSNYGEIIKFNQIQEAAERIKPFIKHTPIVCDKILSERFDTNVYLKLELLQNTGAFKVRGHLIKC